METAIKINNKTFTDKVIATLTKAGYKVFSDLPVVEDNLSFMALAPEETLVLGEVLPVDFDEMNVGKAILKLLAIRTAITNLFIETLAVDIQINISMVVVSVQKAKLSDKMQSALFYSNIKLLSLGKNANYFLKYLPDIDLDLLKNESTQEDYDAYIEYIETAISYLTQNPAELMKNLFDGIFSNISDDDDNEQSTKTSQTGIFKNPQLFNSPRELADEVKKYIKGQDDVIDRIAVPFFQHIESKQQGTTCDIKTSFLLAGNTGTGKSEILRRFAQISDVPIVRINTSDCVPNSWKGEHISNLIGYYINDECDLERMKYAVLVFNEFDKITHYDQKLVGNNSSDWDADMQRDFLKFFDKGYELVIEKQKNLEMLKFRLPTDNLLLCFDGAFSGIEKIIEKRLNLRTHIGFVQPDSTPAKNDMYSSLLQQLTVSDLQKWGYLPELLGRIGTFLTMNPMSEELVYEIITTASENILNAHKTQCSMHGFNLEFTEDALRKIAKMATESGLGFRSVKTILASLMEDVYFDCDKYKNTTLAVNEEFITLGHFRNKYRPLIKDYKKMSQGKIKVEHLLEKYNYTPEEYAQKLTYLKQL
ncbi:MAG: AAA family ATPase [Prevotellaceae bacterium]|jgi:ATP-dependent protease Clp ATPase subunit|nr:AAA family ATPase [Prevotellaceae bacterium]